MPKFRTKIQEVEAIRLRLPLMISGSSDNLGNPTVESHSVNEGDWLLTHADGAQEIVNDADFHALYEQLPPVAKRGRPPKSSGVVAVASTRRKRRHRARNKNGTKAKAA